jgi:hypothetical protein
MLKALEAAARVASLPADAYLIEDMSAAAFFTGVRTVVIGGAAHLLFYAEQPSAHGHIEYVVVARLVAREMRGATGLPCAQST